MQESYLLLGVIVAVGVVLFFVTDRRWRKVLEEIRTGQSSQPMWGMMQQQV